MSWGAQNRSKDAKTPSAGRAMSKKPELGCCPVQPYLQIDQFQTLARATGLFRSVRGLRLCFRNRSRLLFFGWDFGILPSSIVPCHS
jgi:hypothetical protein